jgi:hypothetical protein
MRKLFSPLLALGLVAALLATVPPARADEPKVSPKVSAAAFTPPPGIIFNNPIGSASQQFAIMNQLVNSVNSVPAGSTIRVAVYSFSYTPMADALIAAFNRGVVVKLIIDDHAKPRTNENTRLRALLNKKTTDASFVATCKYGCMSSKPSFMHAKIYQFSRAGSATYVTMAASANPAFGAATASWNNIWTTLNDKVTYDTNVKYFNDMLKDKTNTNYYRTTTSGNLRTYFFPRGGTTSKTDTLYNALGDVDCTKKPAAGYGSGGKTVIRVSAYFWTSLRSYIATRLATMKKAGCDIQVIYPADTVAASVPKRLLAAGIPTYNTRIDINNDGNVDLYVHSKYISINGIYAGKNHHVVFTGAPNFTNNSLRQSNENLVRILDDTATTIAFQNNFVTMRDTASERVTAAGVKSMHADDAGSAAEQKALDTAPDPFEDE